MADPDPAPARAPDLDADEVVRFVDAAPDGILAVDADGTIRYANRMARKLLGAHRELIGQPLGIPLSAQHRQDLEVPAPDGTVAVVEVDFSPIGTAGRDGWSVVLHDVTRRAEAHQSLMAMIQQREDAIAVTSHELRNPLTVMSALVETLLEQSGDLVTEDRVATWRRLERQTARMNSVVEEFLDAARLEAGLFRPVAVPSAVRDTLTEHLGELGPVAEMVDLRIDPGATVLAAPGHLWTIIGNLLVNAARYAGTQIQVRADRAADRWRIRVSDAGPGVAPERIETLFDRYVRAHVDRADLEQTQAGTGLGLWIARSIAECYGGRLWFEPGSPGSVFVCELPAADPATS